MGRSLRVDLNWSEPKRHEDLKAEDTRGPSGLYLVIAGKRIAGRWNEGTFKLIDIGQADDIHLRIAEHEREACWHPHARGSSLLVKISELPGEEYDETDRQALVCCVRAAERPLCGDACNEGYRRDESVVISNGGKPAPLNAEYAC
jgi:hypothetical protein